MRSHVAQLRVEEARKLFMQHSPCSPIKHCTCAIPAVRVAPRRVLTTASAYASTVCGPRLTCTVSAYSSGEIAGQVNERWPFRRRQTSPRRQRATLNDLTKANVEQVRVWDYILFFQVKDTVNEDAAQKMLDDFWSLQYLVPAGVLNAFAGGVEVVIQSSHVTSCDLTHALHLRFSTNQQLEAFRQSKALHAAKDQAKIKLCSSMAEVAIQSHVPRELECIFRRGSDWDAGFDLVLFLQAKADVQDGEMEGFLEALAGISFGPSMQALQCTYAPAQLLSGQLSGSHLLFARFQSDLQLQDFLQSPPCVAIQNEDARLPARAVSSYVLSIGPPQANRTRAADAGGVLGVENA